MKPREIDAMWTVTILRDARGLLKVPDDYRSKNAKASSESSTAPRVSPPNNLVTEALQPLPTMSANTTKTSATEESTSTAPLRVSKTTKRSKNPKRAAKSRAPRVSLPSDLIITEILLRLPARSVARFRCVCRLWNAETSSPRFLDRHPGLFGAPKFAFVPRAPEHFCYWGRCSSCPRVIGAKHCRGLVLVEHECTTAYSVSVCNPTTGEVLRLPPCQALGGAGGVVSGIGFHSPTREYKVVQVAVPLGGNNLRARVLTLGDARGWRAVDSKAQAAMFADLTGDACIDWNIDPVFADGCIHWCFRTNRLNRDEPHGVLSFSLADESFRRAPQPPFVTADRASLPLRLENRKWRELTGGTNLAELDGRLCMTRDVRWRNDVPGQLEVWKLHDYETGVWSLDYRVDLRGRVARRMNGPSFFVPLSYIDGGGGSPVEKTIRKLLFVTSEQRAQVYDPDANTLQTVTGMAGRQGRVDINGDLILHFENSLRIVQYQESLVRFPGMERCDGEIKFEELEYISALNLRRSRPRGRRSMRQRH